MTKETFAMGKIIKSRNYEITNMKLIKLKVFLRDW